MDHVPGDLVAAGEPVVPPDGLVVLDADEVTAEGREVAVEVRGGHGDGLVLRETAGGGLHDGERLGENLVETLLDGVVLVLDELVGFGGEGFLLGDGDVFLHLGLDFGDAVLEGLLHFENLGAEGRGAGPELVIGQCVDAGIGREDLVQHRLHQLHIAIGFGSENLLQNICECHKCFLTTSNLSVQF